MLTIAALSFREATRRRLALVAVVAAVIVVAGSAWGTNRLAAAAPSHPAGMALVSALTIFLAFVFSVVLSIGAAFLGAPAIAGDIESGVILAIVPRPLSRAEFVLGKWLGLALLLALAATVFGAVEVFAIMLATGYRPPHPAVALLFLIAQALVMLSLALGLGTRLPPILGGLLAVLCFGVAWISGIAAGIAAALHNDAVLHATTMLGLIVPSDGLWRAALYQLEPVVLLAAASATGNAIPNPFGANTPPEPAFIAWSVAWIMAALAVAIVSFVRRDL